MSNYIKILFLLRLPSYSEFLVTYVIILIFVIVFNKQLKSICKNNKYIIISIIISMIFFVIPQVKQNIPWLNLFIKTNSISFPVFSYLNLFFIGIWFSKNKPKFCLKNLYICAIFYLIFVLCVSLGYTSRFPVSLSYIFGSYLFIYLYFYFSKFLRFKLKDNDVLNAMSIIGRNSLLCLLISNIMLLFLSKLHFNYSFLMVILCYILVIIVCFLFSLIKTKITSKKS